MIKIEGLSKRYGQICALDGLSLQVEPGAIYGFLGPNGAGKTTTMRILAGLARPDQGKAWILDREVGRFEKDVRHLIGVLPEEPAFYPWMTAREYLRDFIAPLFHLDGHTAGLRSEELLAVVGLEEAAERRIAGFSRGMRQRLGLAQALIHHPPVLLLDEPVSALDPAGRKEILELISGLRERTTILLSTHILTDVERICDVIGIIARGRLVIQDSREDILARYAQPLIEVEVEDGFGVWLEKARQVEIVEDISWDHKVARLLVREIGIAQKILFNMLAEEEVLVRRFEIAQPSLEDIFIRLTQESRLEPS